MKLRYVALGSRFTVVGGSEQVYEVFKTQDDILSDFVTVFCLDDCSLGCLHKDTEIFPNPERGRPFIGFDDCGLD